MGVLFGGAFFLAAFEDPAQSQTLPSVNRSERVRALCADIQREHDVDVTPDVLDDLMGTLRSFEKQEADIQYKERHQKRR